MPFECCFRRKPEEAEGNRPRDLLLLARSDSCDLSRRLQLFSRARWEIGASHVYIRIPDGPDCGHLMITMEEGNQSESTVGPKLSPDAR